jgi:hypothetical protein
MAGDMPEPSVTLTMMGALLRAHLATLSPKKRRQFLAELMKVFAEYEETANVVRLRSATHDEELTRARREAIAWTRGMMAAFWLRDLDKPE